MVSKPPLQGPQILQGTEGPKVYDKESKGGEETTEKVVPRRRLHVVMNILPTISLVSGHHHPIAVATDKYVLVHADEMLLQHGSGDNRRHAIVIYTRLAVLTKSWCDDSLNQCVKITCLQMLE